MLAGVSLDYYARLEQGRDLQPSDQVLDAIARALRLAEVERSYLHNLIRSRMDLSEPGKLELAPLPGGMRLMLGSLSVPGLIIDLRGDVHAMNRMGRALLVGLEPMPSQAASLRWLFLSPATRELLIDWEMIARASVGILREAAGRYPRDQTLHALIGELSVASPEFRSWWAEHDVDARCGGGLKRFYHPAVGELVMHIEALGLQDGGRWLYLYAVEPGSRSEEGIRLIESLVATQNREPSANAAAGRPACGA